MTNMTNEILRQISKVKRILMEIGEEDQKYANRVDTALYAILKAEKIIHKFKSDPSPQK